MNNGRQKNKTEDRKVETNESPEIQNSRETLPIPGLPSGKGGGGGGGSGTHRDRANIETDDPEVKEEGASV